MPRCFTDPYLNTTVAGEVMQMLQTIQAELATGFADVRNQLTAMEVNMKQERVIVSFPPQRLHPSPDSAQNRNRYYCTGAANESAWEPVPFDNGKLPAEEVCR